MHVSRRQRQKIQVQNVPEFLDVNVLKTCLFPVDYHKSSINRKYVNSTLYSAKEEI